MHLSRAATATSQSVATNADMKAHRTLIDLFLKEWILIFSGAGFLLTSAHARHFPTHSVRELQVLFLIIGYVAFFLAIGLYFALQELS